MIGTHSRGSHSIDISEEPKGSADHRLRNADPKATTLFLGDSYSDDVARDIVEEIVHFREFVSTGGTERLNRTNLCQFLIETNPVEKFPNLHVAFRMYKK